MIHHVRGVVVEKSAGRVVIEVGGLGLEVLVGDATWRGVGGPGTEATLKTHLVVRDDGWTLFGFASEEERAVFRLLLGVQGVGPRLALAVLSGVPLLELRRAVTEGDVDTITATPGVGRKTARRLIVDLKDRLGDLPGGEADVTFLGGEIAARERDDAVDALIALGYPRIEAREAVRRARGEEPHEGEDLPVETIVKSALRRL
jgi:Holliday junction DNA helicase RuvA